MQKNTWLADWVDRWNLSTAEQVAKAVGRRQTWDSLIEYAYHQDDAPETPPLSRKSVVAGRSLDLTGFLACGHPDCLSRQVDKLFSQVWHYFDQIAVVGPDSHVFLEMVEANEPRSEVARRVAGYAQVLFHVRETGLGDLLVFTKKPASCPVHWPALKELQDLQLPDAASDRLAR
jgi:hypothetical protein